MVHFGRIIAKMAGKDRPEKGQILQVEKIADCLIISKFEEVEAAYDQTYSKKPRRKGKRIC